MTGTPPTDDLPARLQAAAPGELVWLPVNGRSFFPLLRPGDSIGVERCQPDALRRGDVVLMRRQGLWSLAVVGAAAPLRLGTLRGVMHRTPGTVHGRVAAVRRGARTVEFGAGRRAAALALQRSALAARRVFGPAARFVRSSPATRRLRAWRIGPLHVRRVRPEDAAALDAFAARNLPQLRDFVARQVRGRWTEDGAAAVAGFDSRGAVHAFLFADRYTEEGIDLPGTWLRAGVVPPWARRLGLMSELIRLACAEVARGGVTRVYGDVRADNGPSLAMFRKLGFGVAPAELAENVNRALVGPGEVGFVVVESPLPLPEPGSEAAPSPIPDPISAPR